MGQEHPSHAALTDPGTQGVGADRRRIPRFKILHRRVRPQNSSHSAMGKGQGHRGQLAGKGQGQGVDQRHFTLFQDDARRS